LIFFNFTEKDLNGKFDQKSIEKADVGSRVSQKENQGNKEMKSEKKLKQLS